MPEYFGAPYKQAFIVPLPLDKCVKMLRERNEKRTFRFYQLVRGWFTIYIELTEVDEMHVEFVANTIYRPLSVFRTLDAEIYGGMVMHGYCQYETEETTFIHYDFMHDDGKSFFHRYMPKLQYQFYREMPFVGVVFIGVLVALIIGATPLALSIIFNIQQLAVFGGCPIILIFACIVLLHEALYPITLLDNFIRNTFWTVKLQKVNPEEKKKRIT